jgi:Fur family ferric uptake transcriptional regulator
MKTDPHSHAHHYTAEELRALFSRKGLRTTRQREIVLCELTRCNSHPTAEELLAAVREIDPDISQATIYNTLEAFVGCGIARRISSTLAGGACRYDADMGEHVHLVLEDGRVMDVPMDLSKQILDAVPESVLQELSQRVGFELSGIKIELLGH